MRKLLSIFLLFMGLLISKPALSQGTIIFDSNNCNKWLVAQDGRGSFYMNTSSDYIKTKGYYYFYIFFFSNASDNQGYLTAAYIEDVTVSVQYFDNIANRYKWKTIFTAPYVLVQPKSPTYDGANNVAYVYSTNIYQKIKVTWSGSTPY